MISIWGLVLLSEFAVLAPAIAPHARIWSNIMLGCDIAWLIMS
jgi:hypothetical protein